MTGIWAQLAQNRMIPSAQKASLFILGPIDSLSMTTTSVDPTRWRGGGVKRENCPTRSRVPSSQRAHPVVIPGSTVRTLILLLQILA